MNDESKNGKYGMDDFTGRSQMTGEEAFSVMYGRKGEEYPDDMKQEFLAFYDRIKELLISAQSYFQASPDNAAVKAIP